MYRPCSPTSPPLHTKYKLNVCECLVLEILWALRKISQSYNPPISDSGHPAAVETPGPRRKKKKKKKNRVVSQQAGIARVKKTRLVPRTSATYVSHGFSADFFRDVGGTTIQSWQRAGHADVQRSEYQKSPIFPHKWATKNPNRT